MGGFNAINDLGVLLLTAGVAHAEPGAVTGWGVGSKSCGRFIATIGKLPPGKQHYIDTKNVTFVSENTEYQQWLMGFLTGFNTCNQHPTESVFHGALAFIDEMRTNAAAAR